MAFGCGRLGGWDGLAGRSREARLVGGRVFFFQAEDGIRDLTVTGVQTCALPILTCGGTLAKAVRAGHRVGIIDLTQGETGTRGDAGLRAAEAERAARALGVPVRLNAGLPDAHLQNEIGRAHV